MLNQKIPLLESLGRIRESCLFLLKIDFVLVAGVATLASLIKLEATEVVSYAIQFRTIIKILFFLVIYALVFEWALTHARNTITISGRKVKKRSIVIVRYGSEIAYALQIFAHTLVLSYVAGYVAAFLECRGGACS